MPEGYLRHNFMNMCLSEQIVRDGRSSILLLMQGDQCYQAHHGHQGSHHRHDTHIAGVGRLFQRGLLVEELDQCSI